MEFYKYHGCGNDFILLDGRNIQENFSKSLIEKICHRRFGVGADGFMILSLVSGYDFEMKYYNSDGKESSFCGNGGRCIVKFAQDLGIIRDSALFLFEGKTYTAFLDGESIFLHMKNVDSILVQNEIFVLDTGSPHHVTFIESIDSFDLITYARHIRFSDSFPDGINVNIVEQMTPNKIKMRTYERGVEDETYSCGTGVVAAVLAASTRAKNVENRYEVETKGGQFEVEFQKDEIKFHQIILKGPAEKVFQGTWGKDRIDSK
ncbi:MAG: diaminopimelate epimerase [Chitinophagales bacterium]